MSQVERYVTSIEFLRDLFIEMDDMADPVMGIRDWDDSVCVNFCGGKLLASTDGPYSKRLVMKSALIHAATDVVVKGGRPFFCLDNLIGPREDVEDMAESLMRQALAMKIPVLGGNTLFEEVEPRCTITVVGELILKKPIRDSGAREGDSLILLGEPLWGSQDERIQKAKTLFGAWYQILDSGIRINSAKDVTKGGLLPTIYEMSVKSGRVFDTLDEIPLPLTRNLDNFLLSVTKENKIEIQEIAQRNKCTIYELGSVK